MKENDCQFEMVRIRRIQNILADEYRQPLNIRALAQRLNVSREHLYRTFRRKSFRRLCFYPVAGDIHPMEMSFEKML